MFHGEAMTLRRLVWLRAVGGGLLVALAGAGAAWAEVRVERLPDGTQVVRNVQGLRPVAAPRAPSTITPAALPAALPAASVRPAVVREVSRQELERLVDEAAGREGVDPRLAQAVVRAESGWNPAALSRKGAMGLMQLMPGTAVELAVADPWDAAENVRGGVTYLRRMIDRFGDLEHAVAAYNAGPAAVEQYQGLPPYPETRDYVRRVLSIYHGRDVEPSSPLRGPPPKLVRGADGRMVLTNTAGR
jgi:soluble lytic murein transglycosylase-like protein